MVRVFGGIGHLEQSFVVKFLRDLAGDNAEEEVVLAAASGSDDQMDVVGLNRDLFDFDSKSQGVSLNNRSREFKISVSSKATGFYTTGICFEY